MRTNNRPTATAEDVGLGPKKTFLVLFTVVGCIAILFPKIFYPMIVGPPAIKDANRQTNLLKQERPSHLRDVIHPGMQERGRAIPPHSVPIIERPGLPGGLPPRPGMVERRPGSPLVQGQPGPNMRAAAYQAQQQPPKGQGPASIIMPIYTFGIVAFFVFTIVKIVMKKMNKNNITPVEPDPIFTEKVFRQAEVDPKKKLVYTAIQGIIDATNEQLKEIEKDCAENNEEHFNNSLESKSVDKEEISDKSNHDSPITSDELMKLDEDEDKENKPTEHDLEIEKRLNHLREAMHIKSVENDENSDLKSIFLEGELPHDPQILVSATETETKMERMSNYTKDVADDEAVILSGKMTISLISYNDEDKNGADEDDHVATTNNVA